MAQKARRTGRPSTKPDLVALVVGMAKENPTWGYTRIRGGLKRLGHDVARNTIKAIGKDHGIEPTPERGGRLLHCRSPDPARPFRDVVFFVMKLKTRTVEIVGITCQPDEAWMIQVART